MRRKYFGWEYVFEFIWKDADRDAVWDGDGASLGEEFGVTEDEGYETLSDLADRGLIEKLFSGTSAVVKWPERNVGTDAE
jgi:hypothetical protein